MPTLLDIKKMVQEHFDKLILLQNLTDMRVVVLSVQPIDLQTDFLHLADVYSNNFCRSSFDDNNNFLGLKKIIATTEERDTFKINMLLPILSESKFFVISIIYYQNQSFICPTIVKDNASVGDTSTIIDPFTLSYYVEVKP